MRRTTRDRTGRSGGSSWNLGGGNASVGNGAFAPAEALTIAPSNVREKAQASKDQSRVWAEVARTERENKTSSATGNLNAVFEDKRVRARLEDYRHAFAKAITGRNVVGVVVAVGGKLRSADVFATHSLFGVYWPKLLKSYSLEAASAGKAMSESISVAAAEAFLSHTEGTKSPGGNARAYRLIEHQSDKDASFELVSASKPSLSPTNCADFAFSRYMRLMYEMASM